MNITGTDRFYENTINMVMKEVYERRSLVNIDKIVVIEDDATRKSKVYKKDKTLYVLPKQNLFNLRKNIFSVLLVEKLC
jgi:hypothetical protein